MTRKDCIRFVLDGELIELSDVDPCRTVLQYLREDLRRKGSKEGCAEGDCGACTVVIAEAQAGGIALKAVNACIQFLPLLDGKQLITVESLSDGDSLHPVQQAMVDKHASQCGFCTPGIVMSLFALYENEPSPDRQAIDDALAGNLCRCTGYRPIVDAAKAMYSVSRGPSPVAADVLTRLQREESLALRFGDRRFYAPLSCDELAELYLRHPDATILAGGTDVGLWVTKQHRELQTVIYTGQIAELKTVGANDSHIEIGAAAPLSDAVPVLLQHYPGLEELFRRFASPPIRNAGTLGGNIANGSPIGDSMAALMVVDTTLLLRRGDAVREVRLDEFYKDYMVNDLQPSEFLQQINVPLPVQGDVVRSHKWSKRFDQDISAVCTAYRLRLDGNAVSEFRMACGGLAATVKRAQAAESVLAGCEWQRESVEVASAALAEDFQPIDDMRASADIRLRVCQNLLRRFFLETSDAAPETVYTYGRSH